MAHGSWDLDQRAVQLERAGVAWSELSAGLAAVSETVASRSQQLLSSWEGQGATSYDGHRLRLVASVDDAATLAADAAARMDRTASSVQEAQEELDRQWAVVSRFPLRERPDGSVLIYTETTEQRDEVREAIEAASLVRSDLDATLSEHRTALQSATVQWQELTEWWRPVMDGTRDGFRVPAEGSAPGLLVVDGKAIVNLGGTPDEFSVVSVRQDRDTGHRVLQVVRDHDEELARLEEGGEGYEQQGTTYRIPPDAELVVRGARGSSKVQIDDRGATVVGNDEDVEVAGGAGDDRILGLGGRDLVTGGGGRDLISGGSGPDNLDGQRGADHLAGGSGHDAVYGGPGDDVIAGDEGSDHHEGGRGDDEVSGGQGTDVLSGGRDDDRLLGGGDDDVAYGGFGVDSVDGGDGSDDRFYDVAGTVAFDTERSSQVTPVDRRSTFDVDGSPDRPNDPDYQERVSDDLLFLGSSQVGQSMLHELHGIANERGIDLSIVQAADADGSTAEKLAEDQLNINYTGTAPENVTGRPSPPPAVLFHEMNHVRAYGLDRIPEVVRSADVYQGEDSVDFGQENVERWAVGLPVDHDNDPYTPEELDPGNPLRFTENGLLLEFGWPEREHYNETGPEGLDRPGQ
ncbi:MAG: M91 family zinc metallopeptidase [Dermatophilaceae bacterium]